MPPLLAMNSAPALTASEPIHANDDIPTPTGLHLLASTAASDDDIQASTMTVDQFIAEDDDIPNPTGLHLLISTVEPHMQVGKKHKKRKKHKKHKKHKKRRRVDGAIQALDLDLDLDSDSDLDLDLDTSDPLSSNSAHKRWHNRRAPSMSSTLGTKNPFDHIYQKDGSIVTVHEEKIDMEELSILAKTYVRKHFRVCNGALRAVETGEKSKKIKRHALYFLHAYNTNGRSPFAPKDMTQPWKESVRALTGVTMHNNSTFQIRDWIDGRHQHPFIVPDECTQQCNPRAKVGRYLKVHLCEQLVQAMQNAIHN